MIGPPHFHDNQTRSTPQTDIRQNIDEILNLDVANLSRIPYGPEKMESSQEEMAEGQRLEYSEEGELQIDLDRSDALEESVFCSNQEHQSLVDNIGQTKQDEGSFYRPPNKRDQPESSGSSDLSNSSPLGNSQSYAGAITAPPAKTVKLHSPNRNRRATFYDFRPESHMTVLGKINSSAGSVTAQKATEDVDFLTDKLRQIRQESQNFDKKRGTNRKGTSSVKAKKGPKKTESNIGEMNKLDEFSQ